MVHRSRGCWLLVVGLWQLVSPVSGRTVFGTNCILVFPNRNKKTDKKTDTSPTCQYNLILGLQHPAALIGRSISARTVSQLQTVSSSRGTLEGAGPVCICICITSQRDRSRHHEVHSNIHVSSSVWLLFPGLCLCRSSVKTETLPQSAL